MQRRYSVVVFSLLLAACTSQALAEDHADERVQWVRAYDVARREGTKSSRPVLLFLTTEHCRYCVQMKREAFRDAQIAKELNESFVPAMLHVEPHSKLGEALKVTIYPTTVIIHPNGRVMDYARGYVSREELQSRIRLAKRDLQLEAEKTAAIASSR